MRNKKLLISAITAAMLFGGCATTGADVKTPSDCIQKSEISKMALANLQQIKQDTAEMKALGAELAEYTSWLSVYFTGYSKHLEQAATYSPLIKLIPLPYAGQAGDIVKFGSKLTVSITNSAVAIDKANKSIAKYEEMLQSADTPEKVAMTARFADERLIPDLRDAQVKNETLKDMSLSLLAFGESVEKATAGAQDALLKAKSLFSSDTGDKDKAQKVAQMRQKLDSMKAKTARIDEIIKKSATLAKRASVYSELIRPN